MIERRRFEETTVSEQRRDWEAQGVHGAGGDSDSRPPETLRVARLRTRLDINSRESLK